MTTRGWVGAAAVGVLVGRQITLAQERRSRRTANRVVRESAIESAITSVPELPDAHLAVVIAAYNEAQSIKGVLAAIPRTVCGLPVTLVVVDDGSSDDTGGLAADGGAIVARHSRNLGQGDGLRTGFAVALSTGAAIVVTMDADGQHNPDEIADLVRPVVADEADYVQGSRFLGKYDEAGGARHAGIKGFTGLINTLAGTAITDCTNGFRAIRASGLARMQLREDRFSASEIIIEASTCGLRMVEVPVHIRVRDAGESKKPRGLGYPIGYFGAICRSSVRSRLRAGRPAVG